MKFKFGKQDPSQSFTEGQQIWFRDEDFGWVSGRVIRPTSPERTHYHIAVEGDHLRAREVQVKDIKPYSHD